jgi:superfamily II DNA or RNA helicase
MAGNNLLSLIENIQTWNKLEKRIADLPTERQRGNAFEEFCHAFFLLDPVFQFKEVYRHNAIPHSIREQLGYPGIQDIGIDGVGITDDGRIFAYQAKFRSDRKSTPTLRELSTFFTVSDKADWRITIANSNKLPSSIDDRVRQSRILADRFDALDSDFFDRLANYLKTRRIAPPAKKSPHITQQEAIEAAVLYYEKNKRGQLILPCGAGKTLASIWISEKLESKNILIMLPSLSLLSQTLREWAINASIPFRYLCICSDTTVDLGNDSPIEKISDMDVPVTTEVETIRKFLKDTTSKTSIIFSTYQSSKVLAEAVRKSETTFDIGIFDEAHRTAGTKIGAWGIALDDGNIPINKRIFMTATPKIYAPHITRKAKVEDVLICSMDDADMYGHPFYEIGFAEAVKRGHITDYKVIVICVTDSEVKKIIEKGGRVITDQDHEWDAKALAKRIALVKGIRAYGLRKAFTFHGRVESAKAFTDTSKPYGIDKIFNLIEPEKEKQKSMGFFHVNGTMSSGTRSNILKEFESVDIGIMSNARCLTEGVNIPAVDTVAFIDPKRSLIDIVQATGRAMRKAEWKENGYIFIPVFLDEDSDPEQIIKNSDFGTVWEVLEAMLDQDQRMQGIVSNMRILQGKGEQGSQAWKDAMTEYAEKIEFYDLPVKIDKIRFIEKLNTRIVEIIGRQWDFWYGLTLRYKESTGNPNAPQNYKTVEGYQLGRWQGTQKASYKKRTIFPERIIRLEEIGFTWDQFEEQFEKGFQETLLYKERTGNPNVPLRYKTPEGFPLGSWQSHQKINYKKRIILPDRIKRLEDIGFKWEILEEQFEKGFQETLLYKERTGNPNAPTIYNTPEGYPLGSWQSTQRTRKGKGKLSLERINLLEDIGFTWNQFDEQFEQGFQETLLLKERTGNPNAPEHDKTPEGFRIGWWQGTQRGNYKKGKLSPDRINRLEEIGFTWNKFGEQFEKGFQETLLYKERTGNPNAPGLFKAAKGFSLGNWQIRQRINYKKGILSPDRINRLEEIGFTWNQLDEKFEKGFQETLLYKESTGNPNASLRYKTPEGFPLGSWQSHQKVNYKKGKLSSNLISRLEEIGFIWDILEEQFEKGFQETLLYKEKTGNPNAPHNYKTVEDFLLGSWQSNQKFNYRKGKLSPDRIKRLENIGFKWDILEEKREKQFEQGFQETLLYKESTGNPNAPRRFKTPEGYQLGSWQSNQKFNYSKRKLSSDGIKRLEDIGFKWKIKEELFEKGFQETLLLKERTGNSNAEATYKAPEGYMLGNWQSHQRQNYKKGKLSPDRIKRLEEIGFKWGKTR